MLVRSVLVSLALAGAWIGAAVAQERPQIWNVQLGGHVSKLPALEWVDPHCGTNGGPRSLPIESWENFARCPREAETGLREIWFQYDDEAELLARAMHDEIQMARFRSNFMFNVPVILSLMVDDQGLVQGYRIISDTRAPAAIRMHAHGMVRPFMGLSRLENTDCVDAPPLPGERPFEGVLIKQTCRATRDGRRATVEARAYLKPGQNLIDPVTQQPYPNAFESFARLEILNAAALPRP